MAVILRVATIVANGVITPFAFLHGKPAGPVQPRDTGTQGRIPDRHDFISRSWHRRWPALALRPLSWL